MEIVRGCECNFNCMNCPPGNDHPVAFLVERDGKELKVCTRCDLSRDIYITKLFDEKTPINPFITYDPLGAMVMTMITDDKEWTEWKERKNKEREARRENLKRN